MGVLGLWRLLDATGKPVPLETLEGKVLAIDISIWIHQVVQGYQDRRGNAIPNAHLIGLFNRICKLMYFKIKPVFVFDGGVPLLKKNTIATRRKLKSIAASKAQKLKNDLINNLIKHTAVKGALDKGNDEGESSTVEQLKDSTSVAGSSRIHDMFKLPDISIPTQLNPDDYIDSDESDLELSPRKQTKWAGNIHSVDVNNEEFKNLPADVRYDILTDLKETRKQNSWGRIHELPAGSNNYSGFQVKRLLKRRYVQESLEVAEKEMGGKTLTLEELDRLLTDQGINTTQHQDAAYRIASDSTSRVVYLKDKPVTQNNEDSNDSNKSNSNKQKNEDSNNCDTHSDAMSINSDSSGAMIENIEAYDLDEEWNSEEEFTETTFNESKLLPKSTIPKSVMNPALSYMLEHSGLSRDQILKIVETSKKNKRKSVGNSSCSSSMSKKRTPKRRSIKGKNKKTKQLENTAIESKVKKEIINESNIISFIETSSESEGLIEIPEKSKLKSNQIKKEDPDRTITMESSGTESDDFVEVQDVLIPDSLNTKKEKSNNIQVTFKADEALQDDIFADVFNNLGTIKNTNTSIENIESSKVKKEIINESKIISFIESSSESKDLIKISEKSNIKIKQINNESLDRTITMESSDTESDDFIEIQDDVIPNFLSTKNAKNNGLQVTFKADEALEDDIFADIFNDRSTTKNTNTSTENKPGLNTVKHKEFMKNDLHLKSILKKIHQDKEELFLKINSSEGNLELLNSEYSKTESDDKSLSTTTEKINLHTEGTSSPTLLENSAEIITIKETIDTKKEETNIETIDISEAGSVKNQDSDINAVAVGSETNTTENSIHMNDDFEENVRQKEPPILLPVNEEELESMKRQLENEHQQITGNMGKLERQATDITDQMRLEAQELLRLFGVPYLVAPMEAEAQCAYLEQIKLTDGTITDDSDIWLFGGHCVYKNFFDNNKKVLQFLSKDIEHHFNLSRKEMILLALLVGSDYTNGLASVGPVTALEILAAFPYEGEDILRGLRSFVTWLRAGKLAAPSKSTLRNKLKNVQIEKGFPSQAVIQAYLCPTIDESKEAFSWSKPNLILLADYVKKKFGWTKFKFEEIITPVMKRLLETQSQKGIESYFKVHSVPQSIENALSKRVQTAVQRLGGKIVDADASDGETSATTSAKPRRVRKTTGKKGKKASEDVSELPAIVETSEDASVSVPINDTDEKLNDTSVKIKPTKIPIVHDAIIPQRERDKANALNSKLKAIEIFRKSKRGLDRVTKKKKVVKKVKDDAELSESSSSS